MSSTFQIQITDIIGQYFIFDSTTTLYNIHLLTVMRVIAGLLFSETPTIAQGKA